MIPRENDMQVRHTTSEPSTSLDELLTRVEHDRELLRELVDIFKADLPKQMFALRYAISRADLVACERSSHALKGMLLGLTAKRAAAAAARLEQLARARDAEALSSALVALDNEVALLVPELESHLAKVQS
jgi:HPt (histidine-containing phosphotransfer) domain-containing protein